MSEKKTCPRKQSDMTPCVVTDGVICYVWSEYDGCPICVGCERGPATTGVEVNAEEVKAAVRP